MAGRRRLRWRRWRRRLLRAVRLLRVVLLVSAVAWGARRLAIWPGGDVWDVVCGLAAGVVLLVAALPYPRTSPRADAEAEGSERPVGGWRDGPRG